MPAQLRFPLLGTGSKTDPWRVNLPNYQMVDVDYEAKLALVEVPDLDLPPDPVHAAVVTSTRWERAELPKRLQADAIEEWHAHLDRRYAEHAGRFRPIPL